MFAIRNGIADDILKEKLENTADFFINKAGDTLNASSSGQSANRRLCNALDIIAEYLAMTFSTAFS